MQFVFNPSLPVTYEGWMQKANIGIFERWQKRVFKLQGRCIFYFKKDSPEEAPRGKIPLIDVDVEDLPVKKGRPYCFSIKLNKQPKFAKRWEYLISADSDDIRSAWKEVILKNRAFSIVGAPFVESLKVSPSCNTCCNLLPYFFRPLINALNSTSFKSRGIWTVEVPADFVQNGLALLNKNMDLPIDDVHCAVAVFVEYLKALPDGLLDPSEFKNLIGSVDPKKLRDMIREQPAPVRIFLKELGMHFKKVLEHTSQNNVSQFSLLSIVGPLLIRPNDSVILPPAQVKSVQDQVANCFLTNADELFDDIHQFVDVPGQNVLYRARLINGVSQQSDDILEGPRGLLVHVVREDSTGWCTVFTSNRRVGIIHSSLIARLSQDEEKGANVDELMDVVREKTPQLILLFDSMADELLKLQECLETSELGAE